ncbi:6-hydroxymethylpterin diphosphokinase MptE-like protein [Geothermobacter hydrogeniphilus]|uniref:DUF115 domain-containing protein n=1 Tax=Geothermobacter hydrogeniphilus TaxID=1969733 RepID=A0A1X0YE68_9BACT|nr:6-hydroxymethylpterin diphosphokinase MptE-like protein [Geothermobacter hydrogeniphilus]ORJ63480.1 hypothetical protein B5V00_01035 [Geothermobacter hydrogeniphilus]
MARNRPKHRRTKSTGTMLERLRKRTPQQRADLLTRTFQANLTFFKRRDPALASLLESGVQNPYQVSINDHFLDLIDTASNLLCHPQSGLDSFAEQLGDWHHPGWIDFLDPRLRHFPQDENHGRQLMAFSASLLAAFPQFEERLAEGRFQLPQIENGRRFSPAVVFVGIFHGLHIDHYLSRTSVADVTLIEPDRFKFLVSCHFLDYARLEQRCGNLQLHIGDPVPDTFLQATLTRSWITSTVWLRVLPGYRLPEIDGIVERLRLAWLALTDAWVPADRELRALAHAKKNLAAGLPMLTSEPQPGPETRIAVVGAGPSLAGDLAWLKKQQQRMIIIAAHTAVRVLLKNGIRPDFQVSLDPEWDDATLRRLDLDRRIPLLVSNHKDPAILRQFDLPLLVAVDGLPQPVAFNYQLPFGLQTTGNLALAFACACHPHTLLLLGMDFGFRDSERIHVKGGHFDEQAHQGVEITGNRQLPVAANFPSRQPLLTRPYFNDARLLAEKTLRRLEAGTRILNLSDGARIAGADAVRSNELELDPWPGKDAALAALRAAFEPPHRGTHWQPFTAGTDQTADLLAIGLHRLFDQQTISWKNLASTLNRAQHDLFQTCQSGTIPDLRPLPYLRIIKDLLTTWFRFMVATRTPAETASLYRKGRALLLKAAMEWDDQRQPEHPPTEAATASNTPRQTSSRPRLE